MIEREAAVRLVEEELAREDRKWSALGVDTKRTVVTDVEEHELVWIVRWQSEVFVRTGNPGDIGVLSARGGDWEDDYRARIRGLPVRTAVDDLHDEIREIGAAQSRMHAVRALRQRLPVLSPAQAVAYTDALLGGAPPAHLVSIAAGQLVEPIDPVLTVRTVRRGDPVPSRCRPRGHAPPPGGRSPG
ncbi:YrhB domain-containing protein [Streptomyces murinus]|uniref:YrhB domain-containing protein n=1 Tax=Streptomyces murinus TaxID=33900 RepID=UPI0018F329B4|nr:YrhB domain-containing protein [Streptomyces murinus]